jgi:hypothetical protein
LRSANPDTAKIISRMMFSSLCSAAFRVLRR